MIYSNSSFEIVNAVMPDQFADTASINPNGTKTLLANGVSTFFINGKTTLVNGARKLSNPPY